MANTANPALKGKAPTKPVTTRRAAARRAPRSAATPAPAAASTAAATPAATPARPLAETLSELAGATWRALAQAVAAMRAIPVPPAVRGAWDRLPGLGQAFVVLAGIDVVVRTLGLFGTSLGIDVAAPRTLMTAFFPHNLLILLPAAILARRPDAQVVTPLILRGATAIAIAELATGPLSASSYGAGNALLPWVVVSVASIGAVAAGWLAIGIGLMALYPRPSSLTLAGLANLVGGVIVVAAISSLLVLILRPSTSLGTDAWNALLMVPSAVGVAGTVAWAYIAWVVVRGSGDTRRPAVATYAAAAAMVVSALAFLLLLVANVLGIVQLAIGWPAQIPDISLGWLGSGLVTSALVVAFALGLADTSVRIPASDAGPEPEPEPVDERPSWPTPGGDVPSFRQPGPAPKRRRSKRQA